MPAAETRWPAESFRRVVTGADAKQADKMLDAIAMIAHSGADTVIITGPAGQGRVTYIGPEVGAAYYRFSYPYLRSLMVNSVLQAARRQPGDTVVAPRIVQATFFEQSVPGKAARRVIHLLNEVSSFGRASLPEGAPPLRDEVVPVAGVRVQLSGPVGRVHPEPGGKAPLPRRLPDGRFEVELPPLGLYSLLVVEPKGSDAR